MNANDLLQHRLRFLQLTEPTPEHRLLEQQLRLPIATRQSPLDDLGRVLRLGARPWK
jgi:hypothetical protein